ncbi:hypothetical protein LF1_43600 [Rubripirellula obstinata]|uniref:Uncharacterized protein n=1 Tax=Rubripirellula obstinata TaxID=406547 RepID=A0A5B1CQ90_9BACT|nr:hypothetical protein LF1_43600 [Rubripirellula obstinata]
MFILQFAMFDWFANNITHRIFISPGIAPRVVPPRTPRTRGAMPTRLNNLEILYGIRIMPVATAADSAKIAFRSHGGR